LVADHTRFPARRAGALLFVRRLLLFGREAFLGGNEFKDLRRRYGEPVGELEKAVK
jgi:hypothetical protein